MRLYEITEEFDLEAWRAKLPPNDGDTAYVIHLSKVQPVVVKSKSKKFNGTHEVVITSKGGHQGLLYPTFGKDLFKTEEQAKKALFKQELKGFPKTNAVHGPRW